MENSNTLPKIEVGDTVIFRTDLEEGVLYGSFALSYEMTYIIKSPQKVVLSEPRHFMIEGHWQRFTPEMVAQVIKPTKERMYALCELKKAIEFGCQQGHDRGHINLIEELRFIESLNK